jgi:plastocyanin
MRKLTVQLWLAGLAIVLAGSAAGAQQTHSVNVVDIAYEPQQVSVQVGDTVTWTHTGELPHTVTADDGSFDSHPACPPDCMQEGETFTHTFTSPGEVSYYCTVHGGAGGVGQAGVVVVSEAPDEPEEPAAAQAGRLAETGGVALLGVLAAGLVALGLIMLRRFG